MRSSSRNGARVIWLVCHTTEGIMRARDLRDWSSWPGSSHASNDETGELLSGPVDGFVDYDRAAWTLRAGNPFSDNLEQCGWARWTRAEWLARPKLLDTTARWLADRHKARPWIPLVKLSPAEVRARKPGVIGHADYTYGTGDGTHTDPGPNFPWDVVLAKARAYVEADATPEPDVPELPEGDMPLTLTTVDTKRVYVWDGYDIVHTGSTELATAVGHVRTVQLNQRQVDVIKADVGRRRTAFLDALATKVAEKLAEPPAPAA